MTSDLRKGITMKQNGISNWTEKTFLACTETVWALMVGFEASVLAA
jgi:hypothetical protein